jgi:hypothetical protein
MEQVDEAVERIGARLVERLERLPRQPAARSDRPDVVRGGPFAYRWSHRRPLGQPGLPGGPQVVVDLVDRQPPPQDRGSLLR